MLIFISTRSDGLTNVHSALSRRIVAAPLAAIAQEREFVRRMGVLSLDPSPTK